MSNYLNIIGLKARNAFLKKLNEKTKNKVLLNFVKENFKDIRFSRSKGLKVNLIKRLELNENKINQMIRSVEEIIKFDDPVDKVLNKWKRPNGLKIKKVSIPIGVIGVIYESRPNVTSDVSSLCFKSGNSVILRGGSEAINSNKLLVNYFRKALTNNNLDPNYVQFINKQDRRYVDICFQRCLGLLM